MKGPRRLSRVIQGQTGKHPPSLLPFGNRSL